MSNIFKIIFTIIILMSLSSCKFYLLKYKTLKLEIPNPTSYVFHTPMDSVLSLFREWEANPALCMESYDNPIKEIHKDHEGHDYYCVISRLNQGVSPVHINKMGGGIRIDIDQRALACDSISPFKTKISVIYAQAKLYTGANYIGCRIDFPHKNVPTSTIFEYKLLLFIGYRLGEKDMPPMCYPEGSDEDDFKGLMRHLKY